jgi:hypothetical protein
LDNNLFNGCTTRTFGRHTCTMFYAHGALQLVGTFHNPLPLPPSFESLMGFCMVLHMCGEVGWRLIYAIIVLQEHLGRHTCTIFTHMGPCSLWAISTTPCPCPHLLTLLWPSEWSCTCVVSLVGELTMQWMYYKNIWEDTHSPYFLHMGPCSLWALSTTPCLRPHFLTL